MRRSCTALCLASSLVAGCATTTPLATSTIQHPRDPRQPTCRPRAVLLSPAARSAGLATLGPGAVGWSMVWSEKAGTREALRFLTVDRQGIARSPSAEIVDREGHLTDLTVRVEGDGYAVAWTEALAGAPHRMERLIDGRGRARADVTDSTAPAVVEPAHRCVLAAGKQTCAAPGGRGLEIPAQARVLAERLDEGPVVIAADEAGLQLYVLSCAAR